MNHPLATLIYLDFRWLVFWWIGSLIVAAALVLIVGLLLTWVDQSTRHDE